MKSSFFFDNYDDL